MLDTLNHFSVVTEIGVVRAPCLYHFDKITNTQVLKDSPGAVDLKTILISQANNEIMSPQVTLAIGRSLGVWLRSFHDWTSEPAQAELRAVIGRNGAMRELKYNITYGNLLKILKDFPELLEGDQA